MKLQTQTHLPDNSSFAEHFLESIPYSTDLDLLLRGHHKVNLTTRVWSTQKCKCQEYLKSQDEVT